jgi:hypothetical protein
MEKRYWNEVAEDAGLDWEFADKVLSSHDLEAHVRVQNTPLAFSERKNQPKNRGEIR